jgi:hypothetical protein
VCAVKMKLVKKQSHSSFLICHLYLEREYERMLHLERYKHQKWLESIICAIDVLQSLAYSCKVFVMT